MSENLSCGNRLRITRSISALRYRIIIVAYEQVTELAKSASDDSAAAGSTQLGMAAKPASEPAGRRDSALRARIVLLSASQLDGLKLVRLCSHELRSVLGIAA